MSLQRMQIGEVAERTGLSLRTIRYYEEVGLVRPSARTPGGFRLYTEPDVARLNLVKRMKPLEFALDEVRDLLASLDALDADEPGLDRDAQLDRLAMFRAAAEERCKDLRERLETAEEFATSLRREISRQRRLVGRPR
ncbi:MAG TPA: MerR family transcriptional regulator [Jiangellales bacterium]|nr:MerR family transcriptional regulator [Jiangellales bacterium]